MNRQISLLLTRWRSKAQQVWLVVLCVLVFALPSTTTLGQESNSHALIAGNNDPFAVYEADLTGAASRTLDRAAQPQSGVSTEPTLAEPGAIAGFLALPFHGMRTRIERVERLRPLLDPILSQTGVPTELAAVAVVESGGDPAALSPRGARGLWQLMPDTARRYGLKVDARRDERLDVVKSTRAAVTYLRDLHAEFHDWSLALAAYNSGEQTVQQALARTGAGGFLAAAPALPAETQGYVPAVLAASTRLDGPKQSRLTSKALSLLAMHPTMGR